MNHLDYEFLELNPDYEPQEYDPNWQYLQLSWNEIKELNPDILSDPDLAPVLQTIFLDKVADTKYSVIKNRVTGEYIFPMVPFRGNKAHSRKKYKKIQPIVDSFADKEFSRPIKGGRSSEIRQVHALLITFSYTREYSEEQFTSKGHPIKKWKSYDAWKSITPLINQFKVELSRIVGEKHVGKKEGNSDDSKYVSCLVKEGSEDMYPAPHLVVLFDKPLLAHRYGKQWVLGGQWNDRSLTDSIQAIWERLAGSHCKINAIVSPGGFKYVFKYVMKSIDLDVHDPYNMTKEQKVCLNTHLNQSLHNQHDIIGKKFLEKLDYVKQENLLDITRNELKQVNKRITSLEREIEERGGKNWFTFSIHPHLLEYFAVLKERYRLEQEAYRLKMELSPWFYISGGFSSTESAKRFVIAP